MTGNIKNLNLGLGDRGQGLLDHLPLGVDQMFLSSCSLFAIQEAFTSCHQDKEGLQVV